MTAIGLALAESGDGVVHDDGRGEERREDGLVRVAVDVAAALAFSTIHVARVKTAAVSETRESAAVGRLCPEGISETAEDATSR